MEPKWPLNKRKIVLWGVVITVVVAVIFSLMSLMVRYTNLTPAYATLAGAFIALLGVLVTQVISTLNARSSQVHQQEMEDKRAQDDALQKYLDQISELLIDKHFRKAVPEDDKRAVVRAKTLILLLRLDGERKRILLQFFHEASLIKGKAPDDEHTYPLIDLTRADLSHARLAYLDLNGDDLRGAILSDANLESAILRDANLKGVNLQRARLPGTDLRRADLTSATLRDAVLTSADLGDAKLFDTIFAGVNLSDVTLTDADLNDANLGGARGLTEEQLARSRWPQQPSQPPDFREAE